MSETEIKIGNLTDIKKALVNFVPGSDSKARKLLMDGIELIKERMDVHAKAEEEFETVKEDLGGYLPAKMKNPATARFWVDDIITKRLGGKRVGTDIIWELGGQSYQWDPYSGELRECTK